MERPLNDWIHIIVFQNTIWIYELENLITKSSQVKSYVRKLTRSISRFLPQRLLEGSPKFLSDDLHTGIDRSVHFPPEDIGRIKRVVQIHVVDRIIVSVGCNIIPPLVSVMGNYDLNV